MRTLVTVSGLPAHPLLVHAVLVLLPLAALALVLGQFWPAARARLGSVTLAGALAVAALVPVTMAAGRQLAMTVGPLPAVERHEHLADALLPWSLALLAVAAWQWWWFRSRRDAPGWPRGWAAWALSVAVVAVSAGAVWQLVRVGDSGAQAVWGGLA